MEFAVDLLKQLAGVAMDALPNETGGLLIGWRDGETVVVCAWLQLGTPNPRRNRFEIDSKKATSALKGYLRTAANPLEGYVGAWHTHPALEAPSGRDFETFRSSAAATQAPLAFVVLATEGSSSVAHVVWSGRQNHEIIIETQKPIALGRIAE
ncbi:Mov34/MPN/PAD-1 family protein [Leifsonia sp. NPDC056665]|uniref:Mov34/MPN/PAD-1 family protein n=1 Tax=Leifsonia sp. NPDC056665 TaxID=3345901 RepID=UPI00367A023C